MLVLGRDLLDLLGNGWHFLSLFPYLYWEKENGAGWMCERVAKARNGVYNASKRASKRSFVSWLTD